MKRTPPIARGWRLVIAGLAIGSPLAAGPTTAATWTVNTLDDLDDGVCDAIHCSLREAINEANAAPGGDVIEFDPAVSGAIFLTSELPEITGPDGSATEIRGETAGDLFAGPDIIIDGSGAAAYGIRLLNVSDCLVRALRVHACEVGIDVASDTAGVTANNVIGESSTGPPIPEYGNVVRNNTGTGIVLRGPGCTGNVVGSNEVALNGRYGIILADGPHENFVRRNIVNENARDGITLWAELRSVVGNEITDNLVGTDSSGVALLGNGANGIHLYGYFGDSQVRDNVLSGNVVTDNAFAGVALIGAYVHDNTVQSCMIGVDSTGTVAMGNQNQGVDVSFAYDNTIGPDNVISGNAGDGVSVEFAPYNVITGCTVGLTADRTAALGNLGVGIHLRDGAPFTEISGCAVGGNGGDGIVLNGGCGPTHDVVVTDNLIGTDGTGTIPIPNGGPGAGGVRLERVAHDNTIGPGNLISAHGDSAQYGIGVFDPLTAANQIVDNLIGTTIDGEMALPNWHGVVLGEGAGGNTVGPGNVISGNAAVGVLAISGGHVIQGNYIGTNASLSDSLANTTGVYVIGNDIWIGVLEDTIGVESGNVISGNREWGIEAHQHTQNEELTGLVIVGNHVGALPIPGESPSALANGEGGVWLGSNVAGAEIGQAVSTGFDEEGRNVIAFNAGPGVLVGEAGANVDPYCNTILSNAIYENADMGIDLTRYAPGNCGNSCIPKPLVTLARSDLVEGDVWIGGANLVQVFYDFGDEGKVLVAESLMVGNLFSITIPSGLGVEFPPGVNVAVTNTGNFGACIYHTSEFSDAVAVEGEASVEGLPEIPRAFEIRPAGPNPFREHARFSFAAPRAVDLRARIFSVQGRLVRELHDERVSAGVHPIVWNGRGTDGHGVADGVYFLIVEFGDARYTRRLSLVH